MKTDNNVRPVSSRPVGSLTQMLAAVEEQIDIDIFDTTDRRLAVEVCLIISEMLCLPPDTEVPIGGNKLPAAIVQQVYERLTHEHIALVIDNFRTYTRPIKFKKAYLRTALYNSLFEIDAHYDNLYASNTRAVTG